MTALGGWLPLLLVVIICGEPSLCQWRAHSYQRPQPWRLSPARRTVPYNRPRYQPARPYAPHPRKPATSEERLDVAQNLTTVPENDARPETTRTEATPIRQNSSGKTWRLTTTQPTNRVIDIIGMSVTESADTSTVDPAAEYNLESKTQDQAWVRDNPTVGQKRREPSTLVGSSLSSFRPLTMKPVELIINRQRLGNRIPSDSLNRTKEEISNSSNQESQETYAPHGGEQQPIQRLNGTKENLQKYLESKGISNQTANFWQLKPDVRDIALNHSNITVSQGVSSSSNSNIKETSKYNLNQQTLLSGRNETASPSSLTQSGQRRSTFTSHSGQQRFSSSSLSSVRRLPPVRPYQSPSKYLQQRPTYVPHNRHRVHSTSPYIQQHRYRRPISPQPQKRLDTQGHPPLGPSISSFSGDDLHQSTTQTIHSQEKGRFQQMPPVSPVSDNRDESSVNFPPKINNHDQDIAQQHSALDDKLPQGIGTPVQLLPKDPQYYSQNYPIQSTTLNPQTSLGVHQTPPVSYPHSTQSRFSSSQSQQTFSHQVIKPNNHGFSQDSSSTQGLQNRRPTFQGPYNRYNNGYAQSNLQIPTLQQNRPHLRLPPTMYNSYSQPIPNHHPLLRIGNPTGQQLKQVIGPVLGPAPGSNWLPVMENTQRQIEESTDHSKNTSHIKIPERRDSQSTIFYDRLLRNDPNWHGNRKIDILVNSDVSTGDFNESVDTSVTHEFSQLNPPPLGNSSQVNNNFHKVSSEENDTEKSDISMIKGFGISDKTIKDDTGPHLQNKNLHGILPQFSPASGMKFTLERIVQESDSSQIERPTISSENENATGSAEDGEMINHDIHISDRYGTGTIINSSEKNVIQNDIEKTNDFTAINLNLPDLDTVSMKSSNEAATYAQENTDENESTSTQSFMNTDETPANFYMTETSTIAEAEELVSMLPSVTSLPILAEKVDISALDSQVYQEYSPTAPITEIASMPEIMSHDSGAETSLVISKSTQMSDRIIEVPFVTTVSTQLSDAVNETSSMAHSSAFYPLDNYNQVSEDLGFENANESASEERKDQILNLGAAGPMKPVQVNISNENKSPDFHDKLVLGSTLIQPVSIPNEDALQNIESYWSLIPMFQKAIPPSKRTKNFNDHERKLSEEQNNKSKISLIPDDSPKIIVPDEISTRRTANLPFSTESIHFPDNLWQPIVVQDQHQQRQNHESNLSQSAGPFEEKLDPQNTSHDESFTQSPFQKRRVPVRPAPTQSFSLTDVQPDYTRRPILRNREYVPYRWRQIYHGLGHSTSIPSVQPSEFRQSSIAQTLKPDQSTEVKDNFENLALAVTADESTDMKEVATVELVNPSSVTEATTKSQPPSLSPAEKEKMSKILRGLPDFLRQAVTVDHKSLSRQGKPAINSGYGNVAYQARETVS